MTAWGSIELAVRGMRAGAADFVTKPWTPEQLLSTVATALALSDVGPAREADAPSREELDAKAPAFAPLAGRDPKLVRLLALAARVAPTDASVLVTGESGTGKELLAEAIHRASPRRDRPFVKVNLGGVPTSLFESEMFGHVKGAFTDARQDRAGRFSAAAGGSIFLDEVGELEPAAQVKLLRVLQDRSFEVLGTSVTRTVDVRVISATNRDLGEAVARGAFREDLLYRLNLITLRLPPLRERPDDVPLLAARFLDELSRRQGAGALPRARRRGVARRAALARERPPAEAPRRAERPPHGEGAARRGRLRLRGGDGRGGPARLGGAPPGRRRSRSSSARRSRGASPATAGTSPARPRSWGSPARRSTAASRSTGSARELEGPGPRLPRPPPRRARRPRRPAPPGEARVPRRRRGGVRPLARGRGRPREEARRADGDSSRRRRASSARASSGPAS